MTSKMIKHCVSMSIIIYQWCRWFKEEDQLYGILYYAMDAGRSNLHPLQYDSAGADGR